MTPKDYITERIDADRGVSPVIGVILMVAITVILAAVIGAFVMGMGQNVNNNVNAGPEVQAQNASNGSVTVTWVEKGSAKSLEVTVKNMTGSGSVNETLNGVGESVTIYEGTGSGNNNQIGEAKNHEVQVIVTAVGEDGQTKSAVHTEKYKI